MNNLLLSDAMVGVIGFFLGMLIVFLGILVLIFFVWLAGRIMKKTQKQNIPKQVVEIKNEVKPESDEVPDDVRAAIVAVIANYYFANNAKTCEFKVKKIKRI